MRLYFANMHSILAVALVCSLSTPSQGQYIVSTTGTWDPQYNNDIYVPLDTNQLSSALPIGFNFSFFGNVYTQFYISSNGFMTFDPASGSGPVAQTIPDAAIPNNSIALGWGDLDPEYIYLSYETLGTAPTRTLHVNWGFENYGNGGSCPFGYDMWGQVILYEFGHTIEIHTEWWNGDQCNVFTTQGIENADGTIAFVTPGRNNALWNAEETYTSFTPLEIIDASVVSTPTTLCQGIQDIKVVFQNLSTIAIDSLYLDWEWENTPQTAVFINTPLDPLDTLHITLGQKTIDPGIEYALKAWSYNPDNEPDDIVANDTLNASVHAGLSGILTIGGTTPDYATITDAITALEALGVCDSVIFDIRPGTYTENLDIDAFSSYGIGKAVFQSETENAADVIITKNYPSSGTNRLIEINHADQITLRNLTLQVTGTACANVVYADGDCTGLEISGCTIRGSGCTSVTTSGASVFIGTGNKTNARIVNNDISFGIYGIYASPGFGNFADGLEIESNVIDSSYRGGILLSRPQHLSIDKNIIFCSQSSSYGMELGTLFGECRITQNQVTVLNGPHGIRIFSFEDNNGNDTCLVANNMISLAGGINNSKALQVESTDGARIFHNSIHTTSTVSTGLALSLFSNTPSHLKNNIISNAGIGKAANMGVMVSDHNVLYNTTLPLLSNGSTNYNTLSDWQTATQQDSHSLQENPLFISATDLHTHHLVLNGRGTALTPPISTDFDNETRNATYPDPGADEFGFLTEDIAVAQIRFTDLLSEGTNTVTAIVTNAGTNEVTSYHVGWSYNDMSQPPLEINTPLPAGASDTITLGDIEMTAGNAYDITAFTYDPNGNPDNDVLNDTLSLGPLYPRLNGLYTVGGVSPDFASLNTALLNLQLGGSIDSVQLAIREGFYHDPIVPGVSTLYDCAKPVRIFSESGNPSDVVFDNANLLSPIVVLNNVKGFHFENITFSLTASAVHNVVLVENGATCNSFTGCVFNGRITTQTATTFAVVLCNSNQGVDNDFYNNHMYLGSYGLVTNGPNITNGSQVDIVGNTCVDNYFQGISASNSPHIRIVGNSVSLTAARHASFGGLIANNCKRMVMSHNTVINPFGGGAAINFSECDGTLQDTTRVYNNFVYATTNNALASVFGGSYSDYTHIANNTARSITGRAAGFSWCANFKAENNVFQTMGNNPTLELLNMQGSNIVTDNNCLNAPNGQIGELNNTVIPTLAQWQALGYDLNSFIADPLFDGTTHQVNNALLDGIATPYPFITDDLDGDPRSTNPDLGADEFDPEPNDAGLLAILTPGVPFPTGINPIYVRFYNNGIDTLTTLQFNWSVNGLAQSPFIWNGILAKSAVYDSLEIGNYEFEPYTSYDIVIWITLPNGQPDGYTANDTLETNDRIPGLEGIYTIGGTDPDFETITEAVSALHAGGAADDVIFNIRSGTYAEPMVLLDFDGSDCDRNVTFQPESGETGDVIITNLGINAHTVVMTGADGVIFKNMQLVSVNTSFRHVVLFSGGAHCNQFIDNKLVGFASTSTSNTAAVIRATSGLDTANVFVGNEIKEGSYGMSLQGNGTAITNTQIHNNTFDCYFRGMVIDAYQGLSIKGNTILLDASTASRGIELYNSHMLKEISGNNVYLPLGQYGIWVDNCDNTTTQRGRIYNNFSSVGGTGIARGLYVTGSAFQDVFHNSLLTFSTNATLANTTPAYLTSNPSLRFYNNALKNSGAGYAIYINANTSMLANKNAYHTAGSTFGYYNAGAVETTFANWQTNSGLDANSLNIDPAFMANNDLHTFLTLLNNVGESGLGVGIDIDGEARDSIPDIGADEFDPLPLDDAGIFMFAGPHVPFAHGTKNVDLVIKNFGGNTLTTVTVRWTVNGLEQTPIYWTGSLPSTHCDTVTVGIFLFEELTEYQIDAWTEEPNGNEDAVTDNDLFSTEPFYTSLSGVYTVGGFAPDFNLVSELEIILANAGIVGNVTFNFRPGTYSEAITIPDFPRVSYAHTVTFQSETGDSTDVVLTQNTNNTPLINLDDAHRITFVGLTLLNTKGHGVYIQNGSSQITIEHCRLEGLASLSSSRALIFSSTTTEDSITIRNNVLQHGYYGIYLYGGTHEKKHLIQGNTFLGNFHFCAYLRKFDGLTVTGNLFNAATTGDRDLYMYDGINACTITHNRIISDEDDVAVLLSTMTNTSPTPTQFVNNYIYKPGTTSSDAVQIISVSKINIDFNTIHNATAHASSAALYTENLSTHNIRNTILYSVSGAAFHNSGTLPAVHNYNAIHSLGPVVAQQNSTTYSTLAAYASGTSSNANSKGVDPLFVEDGVPLVAQHMLNGAGLTISGITVDLDNSTRTSPPDIGAKEFTPLMHDVFVSHIAQPLDGCGLEDDETVTVVLVNAGSNDATGFDVHFDFEGQLITENIDNLIVPAGDSLYYSFTQTIDAAAFDTYSISAWHTYGADTNPGNDTTAHSFTNYPPFENPVSNMIPVDGTVGLENQVSLSWAPVEGAVSYDLYLWPSTGSKPLTPTHAGLITINKLVTGLTYGTQYLWQVHAINICGDELPSDTSMFSTRILPDLVVNSITIPPTAFSEQVIGIEWIVQNTGSGNTVPGTWFDNIYLSPDPTYNSFDPLLGSVANLTSLQAGQSYAHSANVTLPQGTNGLYYIIIRTDHYNAVKETSDNNNTTYSATQINVTLSPPPDLIVTTITTPAITFSGQLANLVYEVRNNGSGITTDNIWKDEVWLVPVAGNNNGITKLLSTRTHVGHLEPDSVYTSAGQNVIPENIYGLHQIRVHTDVKNDVFEFASEGNNQTFSDPFEIVLTPPVDLVPDSLVTPDTISLYQSTTYTYEVRNAGGTAPAVGWTDRIYLSQSPVYNSNFLIHAGYAYHNAGLMPGQENDKTIQINITGNYEGTYYFYLVTDYNNKINEFTFEGNNIIRSAPFTIIKPDLRPDSLLHPASAMAGGPISVRTEIVNDGPGYYLSNLYTRYYLSDDDQLSTMNDWLLTSRIINNATIPAEDTLSSSFALYLPAHQFGNKYLLTQVDWAGYVHEVNENNNVLATPIQLFEPPHADIIASAIVTPDTITAGMSFPIEYALTNVGEVPIAIPVTDSLFLSFSPTWNRATAIPLRSTVTSSLDTAQVILQSVFLYTALNQNPNVYYLYVVSDATAQVYEGNGEANNIVRSDSIIVLPYPEVDLALHSISGIADTLLSGQTLMISYTVQNLSSANTYHSSWTERWYLSTDSLFQPATDMLMGAFPYAAGVVLGNGARTVSAPLQIPHGITGDYYLFVETDVLDINNDPYRENNANTVRQSGIAVKLHIELSMYPDLTVVDFHCPVEIVSGQYFQVVVNTANTGEGIAGYRTDKFFISLNNTIESGDLALASISQGPLSANGIHVDTLNIFIPASYSGNYFLLYSTDHGDVVYEYGRESNNLLLTSIIATPPPPADLVIDNILVPDSVLAGNTGFISWETANLGQNPAYGVFREIAYLSTDTIWQVTDEVLGVWDSVVSINPGGTASRSLEVTYNNITNADYHTIIRTDARNNIPESNEDNNDEYSTDMTHVDVEEIFLNQEATAAIRTNQFRYYKLYIEADHAGRNVFIQLNGDSLNGVNQLFVKFDAVPTPADNDYAHAEPFSPNQQILVRDVIPGYYYIMVSGFMQNGVDTQSIELLARISPMEILSVKPSQGGNRGYTTIEAFGSELDSLADVRLVLDAAEYYDIVADTFISLEDGTRVLARFNLENKPLGSYHLRCRRQGPWVATYLNGFDVIEGTGPDLDVNWTLNPKSYNPRFTTLFQIKIDVENRGDADVENRYIRVGSPHYNNPVFYSLQEYFNDIPHSQLVLGAEDMDGFSGVLRPGGRRTYYVFGIVGGVQGFAITYDK